MIPSKLRNGAGILLLATIALPTGALRAQQAEVKILNHGPVHEAYASPVTYDPEPGVVVAARPPAPIRETPPAYRPEGRATVWVPGYWSWSDSYENYIWVSGLWRAVPPGRAWMPGYWAPVSNGFQWVSGYWGDASQNQILYLPAPPRSLEQGPTSAAPDEYSIWAPGNWVWSGDDYAWQPGYWIEYSADWVWVPAEYAWTPSGFIFVDGYWDHALSRRGLLCAPILPTRYDSDFVYTPTVVVTASRLVQHFFCRPAYRHYYFGNYYDPVYFQQGFYPWFAFHQSRYGYDPIYAQYSNYYQRQNNDWFVQNRTRYGELRQDRALRPASYFNQTNVNNTTNINNVLAQDLSQVVRIANQRQGGIRYTQIDQSQRNQQAQTAVKVQQAAQQRAQAEAEQRQQKLDRPVKRARPAALIRGEGEQAAPDRPQAPQIDKTRKRDTNVQRPAPEDVLERDPKQKTQPKPPVQGEQPKTVLPKERPKEQPKAVPPKELPKAVPPKELPKEQPKSAPPKELPKAVPPKELPKEQPKAAPPKERPKELPKAAPPRELPKAAPPKEVPKAAPPKAAPPKELPKAAPPKDIPKAAPPPPKEVPKAPPPKAAPKTPPPKEQPKAAPKVKDDDKGKDKRKGKDLKDD